MLEKAVGLSNLRPVRCLPAQFGERNTNQELRRIYGFTEQMIPAMFDLVMGQALAYSGLTNRTENLLES